MSIKIELELLADDACKWPTAYGDARLPPLPACMALLAYALNSMALVGRLRGWGAVACSFIKITMLMPCKIDESLLMQVVLPVSRITRYLAFWTATLSVVAELVTLAHATMLAFPLRFCVRTCPDVISFVSLVQESARNWFLSSR